MNDTKHRWVVKLDDHVEETFSARAKARDYAAWLRRTPWVMDRRLHGHGGRVEIVDRHREEGPWLTWPWPD